MKKRILTLLLATIFAVVGLGGCVKYADEEKGDISYLYVDTVSSGYGDEYLKVLEKNFEEKFKEKSFADGKTGVDVVIRSTNQNSVDAFATSIVTTTYNIHFASYAEYWHIRDNLYDITDIMKNQELDDGSGTIEGKLIDGYSNYLSAYDNKYYAFPFLSSNGGFVYNAELFEDNNLYFADNGGVKPFPMSSYTGQAYTGRGFVENKDAVKSCGPDGVKGTEDDGMPSSYEEFFYVLDKMVQSDIVPFIWTGKSDHYTNYIGLDLISQFSSVNEFRSYFNFDSNGEEVSVVDGFTDNTPNVQKVKITKDNGYQITKTYTKFAALKFLEHLFKNDAYYDARSLGGALSNTQAQKVFEESSLDPLAENEIAMLVEGAYWYGEARTELEESANKYGADAANRNFRQMRLPSQETGTVTDGNGKAYNYVQYSNNFGYVNKNVAGDAEKEALVKEFIKFYFEEASLVQTTLTTGLPIGVKYDLPKESYDKLDNYEQSTWNGFKTAVNNGTALFTFSNNPIFLNNYTKFCFMTWQGVFDTWIKSKNAEYNFPVTAFNQYDLTAKEYFEGLEITAENWASQYNK